MYVNPELLKTAKHLNGDLVHGYAGYYGRVASDGSDCLVIVIPHSVEAIERLMQEIDLKV